MTLAKTIPVVRLEGVIASAGLGGARTLSLDAIEPALLQAFSMKSAPVVALAINSPGGSPVQSSLIGKRIRQLSAQKNKRVLAFVEDVAASGGYWLACAADEIFVDETSIVGSVGVISQSFGLVGAIDRLGIERRVYTAGRSKSQLDPFKPEDPEMVRKWKTKLESVHTAFIAHVKARRGAVLRDDPGLFEGEIYVGAHAVQLGLADQIGDLQGVLRARFGDSTKLKQIRRAKPSLIQRFLGAAADESLDALTARALWAQYGL